MTNFWRYLLQLVLVCVAWAAVAPMANSGQQQPLDSIVEVVESACSEQARNRGHSEVSVVVRSLDERLSLPLCDQPLSSFPVQADRVLGALSVGVRCAGEKPWTIYVRADVEAQRRIPVLVRPLAGRSLVARNDLELVTVSAKSPMAGVILDPEQIVGMELIRSLDAGSPIKVSQLRRPKVVKRGQYVTLVTGSGGLEVRMQGKAKADAAAGEVVKAANLSSGQLVEGVVNPDGTVTVQ